MRTWRPILLSVLTILCIATITIALRLYPHRSRINSPFPRAEVRVVEPPLHNPYPSHRPLSPELAYLTDSIEDAEKSLNNIQVRYDVLAKENGSPLVSNCTWSISGEKMRQDTASGLTPSIQSSFFWDGKQGTYWTATRKNGVLQNAGVQAHYGTMELANQYRSLSLLYLNGQRLGEALRTRGISAQKDVHGWVVRLSTVSNSAAYQLLNILPSKDYRVTLVSEYGADDTLQRTVKVTRWVGGHGNPWLPGTVVWQDSRSHITFCTLNVVSAIINAPVPTSQFVWQDDGRTPIYDAASHRWVRALDTGIPITEMKMQATLSAIRGALASPPAAVTTITRIHDNGARPHGLCGIQCVWLVNQLRGKNRGWEDIVREYPGRDGEHNMLEVQSAARTSGIELQGLQVPFSSIQKIKTPFIAYAPDGPNSKSGHYYAVVQIRAGQVMAFVPPFSLLQLPLGDLKSGWGPGYVLAPN